MNRIDNPYSALLLTLSPEKFDGYSARLRLVLEKVTATPPGSVELLGLPGMGKTTLLRYLAGRAAWRDASERDWLQPPYGDKPDLLLPILVEFRLQPTGQHALVYLYRRFHEEYAAYLARMAATFEAQGASLPALPARAPEDAERAAVCMEDIITRLRGLAVRPVLLLDDFDLPLVKMSLADTTRMRPWRDTVAFVLTTEKPFHEVNPEAAGSPFFQTIPLERMGGFSDAEARHMLERVAADAGVMLPPDDVTAVLRETSGHPYLLILAGKVLWELRRQLGLKEGQPLGVHSPILRGWLAEEFRRPFHLYLDRLNKEEHAAIQALLAGDDASDNRTQRHMLAALAGKGLVVYDPAMRQYRLFSPLFDEFARTTLPATPERVAPGAKEPPLSGQEEHLYEYLRQLPDHVYTLEDIARDVWHGDANDQVVRRIQVTMSRLRGKLQVATGEDIVSVRGQGYRFVPVSGRKG